MSQQPAPQQPAPEQPTAPARESGEPVHGAGSMAESAPLTVPPAPVAGAHFAELPVRAISPNPRQPRQVFDEEAMA